MPRTIATHRCTCASPHYLHTTLRQASLLPALQQLEGQGLDEGGVSSWVSAARGATNKEVAATAAKKGGGKKAKAATSTSLGATNPFRGSERERWQRCVEPYA